MTIEDIYFPKSKSDIHFDYLVREIATLITHFTVESVIPTDEVNRSLTGGDGLKDGSIHSKGSEFYFQQFREGSEFVFEIKFEGEGKRFRITFEVSGASPNGILTYMVEPDGAHALFSKIKSLLKTVTGNSKDYTPVVEEAKSEEFERLEEKEIYKKEVVVEPQNVVSQDISPLTIPEGRRCACPSESDADYSVEPRMMEMYSKRYRKLYFNENNGSIGMYLCELCGTNLLIEKRQEDANAPQYFLEVISKETASYLSSMDQQLDVIIEDKGVSVIREMLLGGEKS